MSSAKLVNEHDGLQLLRLARESIRQFLQSGRTLQLDLEAMPDGLLQTGASFVTLNLNGQLRGCIGHLEATQALVQDVVENARLAAFSDPRFPPLTPSEFERIEISLSILSAPEPMSFDSETDLLTKIRPGIDGLILVDEGHQGTFLPSVWESLPEPAQFLRQLKRKAGFSENYWSDSLQVLRYTAQHIQ